MSKITRTKTEVVVSTQQEKRYLIADLEREKERLEQALNMPEPTQQELIDLGVSTHEYYHPKDVEEARLKEINTLLGQ